MPRPRPPHLHAQRTRHGKLVWYVRKGKGRRTRILGEYGTPDFEAAYHAAIAGQGRLQPPKKPNETAGSLAWLIARYRETTTWTAFSMATRRQRENIFKQIIATAGATPYTQISQAEIAAGRERRAQTPAQARNFLDAMRGLFRWAKEAGLVQIDPTAEVKNPKRRKGAGFAPWTEDDVAAYQRRWPIGTRQRVWLDVLLYTGLRRGDAVRLGRQHVRNGVATLQLEKSQGEVTVNIPILPVLALTLAAGPCGDLAFICGARGHPFAKAAFGEEFHIACRAAGLRGKSAHGVRKIAATTMANNGATVAELEAIFGWRGGGMASLYTREADRHRLALGSAHKLANDQRTSMPSPQIEVGAPERKVE